MVFHRKNLAGFLNYFLPVHGKNLRKEKNKKYNFYQLLTWSQKFLASCQKTGQGSRNIFLRVHWINLRFEEKWFIGRNTFLFFGPWRKNFDLWSITFRRTFAKNGFYVSIGTIWGKKFLIKLHPLNNFEIWTKKLAFCQHCLMRLSNLKFTCPWDHFEEKYLLKKLSFKSNFGHWSKIFSLSQSLWLRLSKMQSLCVHKNICGRK